MTPLSLASRLISPGQPAVVIAEIGVNHDGSLDRALELVAHAKSAGADAVKLQIFRAKSLLHSSASFATYQKAGCTDATPIGMLERYELSPGAIRQLVAAIRSADLIPLATPFSPADVEAIAELDLPAIKIASPDVVNYPLLRVAASLNRPLLVSTGAATLEEVAATVDYLRSLSVPFALLHCTSSYPTLPSDANLCWLKELSVFGVPVGFSDHTTHELTGAFSVAAGACLVEKHLTYDRAAAGPDHSASADPGQFARYVCAIRLAERFRGVPGKHPLQCEGDVRQLSRQSLVTTRALPANHVLTESDVTTQRPGTGICPSELPLVLKRRTACPIACNTILQWHMLV